MVTRALLDAGHRAVGLCNVAIGLQRYFAALLGVAPESVSLDHVGLNHLTWERAVRVDGADRLPGLLAGHLAEIADHVQSPESVLDTYSFVPSYYLRYYYLHDSVVAEQRKTGTRAAAVAAIEAELLSMYADPALDKKPELLGQRGGAFYSEAAVALLAVAPAVAHEHRCADHGACVFRDALAMKGRLRHLTLGAMLRAFAGDHALAQQHLCALNGALLDEIVILHDQHFADVVGVIQEDDVIPSDFVVRDVAVFLGQVLK